jgi:site-specific recombinase XerD
MVRKRFLEENNFKESKEVYFNITEEFEKFIKHKKAVKDIALRTEKDYRIYFKTIEQITGKKDVSFSEFKASIETFFESRNGKAPATFNIPLTYVASFCNWAVREKLFTESPVKLLGVKRKKDLGRCRNISIEDVNKVISVIDKNTFAGFRDYVIIMITLDCGIRPSELFQLEEEDFIVQRDWLKVRAEIAKTRTQRILHLSPQVTELLVKLIRYKDSSWDKFLFTTYEGQQMDTDRWQKRLREYNKKTGTDISPYDFRHTFAIMFLRNKGNIFALQDILGHSDLTMTRRYVKFANDDLKEEHEQASPVKTFLHKNTRIKRLV